MLTIDVYADVVCPWCYIGERRLQEAVRAVQAAQADLDVALRWRPFQLQPQMPEGGLPWRAFAEQKFGGWDRAEAAFRHVQAAGEGEGVRFDFARVATAPNTVDAHRLILFARERDREWAMAETLFAAYFTHGADLNDRDELARTSERVGLDRADVQAYLATDEGREAVEQSQEQARRLGVGGVPFYVLGGRYGLSGAQPASALASAIRQALAVEVGAN